MKLGELEKAIMTHLWEHDSHEHFTVRDVTLEMRSRTKRPYAYNTILTVITHLYEKKLLARSLSGKTFSYRVKVSKDEFLTRVSKMLVAGLQKDYGSLALSHFVDTLAEIDPALVARARKKAS